MVVDLRRVNALIKPVITLLPKPEELLQKITALNPKFMTCSDLFKGFYQQKISRKSRHITSFTNPYTGVSYSWRVLTMGLLSSPSAFIQMMGAVFKNKQKYNFLFTYVDDLLLASGSFTEHLDHLRTTLNMLQLNRLVINPTKTYVAYEEIEYLGYRITGDTIRISDSKIKAIRDLPTPKNRKSLQRVLGLLQYFRRHIQNFSQHTVNMRELLKKDVKFEWNEKTDQELQYLKGILISNQVMMPLQPNKAIYVITDGIKVALLGLLAKFKVCVGA